MPEERLTAAECRMPPTCVRWAYRISDESNEWLPGGCVVLHRCDTQSFKGAEIIGYDEAEGGYFARMFDNAGHHPNYRTKQMAKFGNLPKRNRAQS